MTQKHKRRSMEQEQSTVSSEPQSSSQMASTTAPSSSGIRNLPHFFSNIGKKEQSEETQDEDSTSEVNIAQARLARAKRGKLSPTTTRYNDPVSSESDPEPEDEQTTKPSTHNRPGQARPPSLFKTRYWIGVGIYLLFANYVGFYETSFLQKSGLNVVLTKFNLFGGTIVISSSTLLFLVTLIALLLLLARFDLIPRSFGVFNNQATTQNKRDTNENAKDAPPTIKQGIHGVDDELYQQYRVKQRRERKR